MEFEVIEANDKLGTFYETDRHRGAKMYGQLWAQVNTGVAGSPEIETDFADTWADTTTAGPAKAVLRGWSC